MLKYSDKDNALVQSLKTEELVHWIEKAWIPNRDEADLETLSIFPHCTYERVLTKLDPERVLEDGFTYVEREAVPCPVVINVTNCSYIGEPTHRTGAFVYRFASEESTFEVLVLSTFFADDEDDTVCLACVPQTYAHVWRAFLKECERLNRSISPTAEVVIIGGRAASFIPTVDWDEIILPEDLKTDILEDVRSFFVKGIEVYKRLNLKPFRKLLLAGVPGTGKTMICSALAKWALDNRYVVIYISSANDYGATFRKIQDALDTASRSSHPTLIILEELDAYLHEEEKAMVLNVLDGSESSINDKGTLLIATTNYPEAIDERVLKRPGRLDRIFIIPETRKEDDAEKMLRKYLGVMWQDEHARLVPHLVGYPGAFIREVAVYALTQVAYEDLDSLSFDLLESSFKGLKAQIDAKDDFLTQRNRKSLGYHNGSLH
ncbi:MAG: hypothetical protein OHK0046_10260 [Anaerolineae bacterium]